ncbi:hypothetical protein EON66_08235 [archaeon]|nr:MAG: hypothetical protein EON66_08235 [archaeon]
MQITEEERTEATAALEATREWFEALVTEQEGTDPTSAPVLTRAVVNGRMKMMTVCARARSRLRVRFLPQLLTVFGISSRARACRTC